MELPKITVQPLQLTELLVQMRLGQLQVPRFQRDFVWPLTKTRALLDSMYKEFPVGTFFLWRAPADSPSLIRSLTNLGIPEPQPGMPAAYILDGQQRLMSLHMVINGHNHGHRIGSRNYGRISIDLETATKFEANREEDFNEDIFVYQSADNQRYVAVKDLLGETHQIYDTVPKGWRPAFNKACNLFKTYPFSVVWIQEQNLGDAIEIFQRINQAGQKLSRYDLVCANVWSKTFDFRKKVSLFNEKFTQDGFGALNETILTQAFALILKDNCTTATELSLQTEEFETSWDRVTRAIQLAINFAVNNLGIKRVDFLPYRGIVVVLAYYFYHAPSSALSAKEREGLWQWFWRVTLSERYGSTSPSRMAEDAQKLRDLIAGKAVSFDYPSKVTLEAVMRTKMTSTGSALRNAVLCMLALKQPRNFKDGSPVNLKDDFFSNLKTSERHHIFPVGYLKGLAVDTSLVHLIPNFCFIPSDLNKEIGSQPPATYLTQYQKDNPEFGAAAKSHLIPTEGDVAVWRNDFAAFLKERARLIVDELNRFVDSKPDEMPIAEVVSPSESEAVHPVDLLEIRLRNFIDHRLAAVMGPHYWKQGIPGDVKKDVNDKIQERISRHPHEDMSDYATGRLKLDFCDASHYEKIIFYNWSQFEEIFKRKDQFQAHLANYRALRNCIQHNREPSKVEQKAGEAAMMWLEPILERYENETRPDAEEYSEELLTEVKQLSLI